MGQATSKNQIRIVPYVHEKTLLVEILHTNILSEELTIEDDHIANIFYLLRNICKLYVRTEKFTKYDEDQLKICLDKINMYTNFLYPHNTLKWTELKYKVVPSG